MLERVLARMRDRIRSRHYVMTLHAEEAMDEDDLSVYDVEGCILSGSVVASQRDANTAERKYCIRGKSLEGDLIEVVAKLGPIGELVIITVYRI